MNRTKIDRMKEWNHAAWEYICVGPKGCGYRGAEKEFQTGRGQIPLKCPKCGKTYTFRAIRKGEIP